MLWPYILAGVIIVLAIIFISYFNRFAVLQNRIENSLSQIDVQLKRRADLVPNLVKAVWAYTKHEKTVFLEIAKARKEFLGASNIANKVKAGDALGSALGKIFALAENYPQLKSNENFLQLQNELAAIEDKVAYSRQFYNDSVLDYDNLFSTFPGNFFAGIYKKTQKEYIKISETERKVPEVKFE